MKNNGSITLKGSNIWISRWSYITNHKTGTLYLAFRMETGFSFLSDDQDKGLLLYEHKKHRSRSYEITSDDAEKVVKKFMAYNFFYMIPERKRFVEDGASFRVLLKPSQAPLPKTKYICLLIPMGNVIHRFCIPRDNPGHELTYFLPEDEITRFVGSLDGIKCVSQCVSQLKFFGRFFYGKEP